MDLCFVIDSSGSIRDNNPPDGRFDNWGLQLDFLAILVDLFTIGPDATRVGVVVFSEDVNLVFALDTYNNADSVKEAIRNLVYLGSTTNTPEGLRVTREECFNQAKGDRRNVQNLAIFISDGLPFPPERRGPALVEAEALQRVASVVAIGVTNVIDEDFLMGISSAPQQQGQNWFVAATFEALGEIRRAVGEGTCEAITGIIRSFSSSITILLRALTSITVYSFSVSNVVTISCIATLYFIHSCCSSLIFSSFLLNDILCYDYIDLFALSMLTCLEY